MASSVPEIELLQASVDDNGESEFRILIEQKFVKYLTIDQGVYDPDDMVFKPVFVSIIPPLPPGDWNTGHISKDASSGIPYFKSVVKARLPGITNVWHPLRIDHLEVQWGEKLRSNVYEATCPRLATQFVAKFARFAWEIPQLSAETTAYEWIRDHDIGPRFLGHLVEEGRVIGFLLEEITDSRHATLEDQSLCQLALLKLHNLGIKHGDVNKHNFLIRDNTAIMLDFDVAERCNDSVILAQELETLEKELRDTSGRGGRIIIESHC